MRRHRGTRGLRISFLHVRLGAPIETGSDGRDLNGAPKSHACGILVSPEYSSASLVSRRACGKSQGRRERALEKR